MTRYLLDSDVVIEFFKGVAPALDFMSDLYRQGDTICTCAVVMAEVYSGFRPFELQQGDVLLRSMRFLTASPEVGRQAGLWRYEFARQGLQLAATDCLIAATAHRHRATLITGNTRHYPMPGWNSMPLPWRQMGSG